MSDSLPQRIADDPFDGLGLPADVILRSKDSVNFHVHKTILFFASPVFRDMFSLPQPPSSQNDTLPVIDVTEDSKVLRYLLHLCYPVLELAINELRDVPLVLEAALKYQMECATVLMKRKLLPFIGNRPLQVYVIACRLQLEEEAKVAAEGWTKMDAERPRLLIPEPRIFLDWKETAAAKIYIPEMAEVSAGAYFRLLRFIRTGNAQSFIKPDPADIAKYTLTKTTPPLDLHPPDLENADIVLQSSEGVNFRVHKWVVSMASPHLLDTEWGLQDDLPVFKILEDAKTLGTLLWLCYPFCDPEMVDIDVADAVLRAARKYQMAKVFTLMKRRYMKEVNVDPLRVYFTAVRFGWKEEAQEAANCAAAARPIDELYVPEMESVYADVYHHLLKYCYCYPLTFAFAYEDLENPSHPERQLLPSSDHEWISSYLKNITKIEKARSKARIIINWATECGQQI